MALAIQTLSLKHVLRNPVFAAQGCRVKLEPHEEQLLISDTEVVWTRGALTLRKLRYHGESVVDATFAQFQAEGRCLVVALKEFLHVYYPDGRKQVLSLPFHVRAIFASRDGLVIEKTPSSGAAAASAASGPVFPEFGGHEAPGSSSGSAAGSSATPASFGLPSANSSIGPDGAAHTSKPGARANFLTLSEPLGEFGVVASSSTSSIATTETLVLFPGSADLRLAVTYNTSDHMVTVYHVRFLSKNPSAKRRQQHQGHASGASGAKSARRPSAMKKPSASAQTPIKSDAASTPALSLGQLAHDKARVVSESMSIDRMASGSDMVADVAASVAPFETSVLRKDIILTKLESFEAKNDRKHLSFHGLAFKEQQCVVLNNSKTRQSAVLIFKETSTSRMALAENYVLPCLSCFPLHPSSGHDGVVAILKDDHSICLANPFLSLISANIALQGRFKAIGGSHGTRVALVADDESLETVNLLISPKSRLIRTLFESLKYLANSFGYEYFWMQWSAALGLVDAQDEWHAFVVTLLSVVIPESTGFDESRFAVNQVTQLVPLARTLRDGSEIKYSLGDMSAKIVLALHLIREDMKLDVRSARNLDRLGVLLSQLTLWMGWGPAWVSYYGAPQVNFDRTTRFLTLEAVKTPLSLLESLASLFDDGAIVPFLTFSQVAAESESVDATITPRTYYVLRLFEVMVSDDLGAVDVVNLMIEFDIKVEDLATYPISIAVPLQESILACQKDTPLPWSEAALELVGRKDILKFLRTGSTSHPVPKATDTTLSGVGPKDIHKLVHSHDESEPTAPWDGQAEADRINVTKLIYCHDRRFLEITTLLQSSRTPTVQPCFAPEAFAAEYDKEYAFHKAVATATALRTLTIPLGRGALFLSSRLPLMTERFPIPKLNFNCRTPNSDQILALDRETVDPQVVQWGFFHNGASSGLTISREAEDITGGWVVFNQPPTFNAQHAGFLLGLGLNGHLKKLDQWHIYNYLGPKHTFTSIGLLLGMAASLKGTMDLTLTKVLSVHVVALLPTGATDLKVVLSVQTAGLVGIGLLYAETQHHRMSEILLTQLRSKLYHDDAYVADEGYRLAAGIGLGYVNLGKGDEVKGLNDTHIVEDLLTIVVSMKDVQTEDQLDKSVSGAILALAFIYLKTNNAVVADKLRLPDTDQLLEYIRPDLLLLRTLSRNVIMWDGIRGSREWVEAQIPACLSDRYRISEIRELASDQLGFYNIIGGACLAIALRYASSIDKTAMGVVLYYLEQMMRITSLPAQAADQKIAMVGAASVRDLLAICCSVIMTGSGDLEIFRRLRVLYGRIDVGTTYGNFMATNMALGFLFLGGGQYAFAKSEFAIASLITAVYPIFPTASQASMGTRANDGHLQALRHFWALSVEPRCLIVRDVETLEPLQVPVELTLANGDTRRVTCPAMVPCLDEIAGVETLSEDHLKIRFDFASNYEYYEIFKHSLTLYMHRKPDSGAEKSFHSVLDRMENAVSKLEIANPLKVAPIFTSLHSYERESLFGVSARGQGHRGTDSLMADAGDVKAKLTRISRHPASADDLWNLRILFKFCDNFRGGDLHYLGVDFIEGLKTNVWRLARSKSYTG